MSSVVLNGDTSGAITLAVPSVAGTNTITLPASTGTTALTSDVIGLNQTWQNLTSSRAAGTTYTNSTGKPIFVQIGGSQSGTYSIFTLTVNGVVVDTWSLNLASYGATIGSVKAIVPNGATYLYTVTTGSLNNWYELR